MLKFLRSLVSVRVRTRSAAPEGIAPLPPASIAAPGIEAFDVTGNLIDANGLPVVDWAAAQRWVDGIADEESRSVAFETVMSQLAVPSVEERPGEWRWIASKLMPESVAEDYDQTSDIRTFRSAGGDGGSDLGRLRGRWRFGLDQRSAICSNLRSAGCR